jgi:TRAP-type C4-dicarboxylate transport system substrate-binding protein
MLEDRTLDGLLLYTDSAYELELHKHARYALLSPNLWLSHLYIVAMNKNTYDSLDQVDKDAIKRAAAKVYHIQGANMDEHFDRLVKKFRADGAEVRLMTKDELTQWQLMTNYQEVQKAWAIKKDNGTGNNNVQRVIDNVASLMKIFIKK